MTTIFWGSETFKSAEETARHIRRNIAEMIPVSYVWKTADDFKEQQRWLWDNVAGNDYQIYGTDPNDHTRRLIYFRHEQDAVYFVLRWS